MTERKPLSMGWESWVDRQIREAEARGAFDDLPGQGKPLAGLDKPYDEDWWLKGLLEREGVSALPATLQLAKDVESECRRIASFQKEQEVRAALVILNKEIQKRLATATSGPSSRVTTIDIERYIEEWARRARSRE